MTGHEREGAGAQARGAGSDEAAVRAWRDASDEAPAAALDATILAAARSTVATSVGGVPAPVAGAVRASSRYTRWQPLAIAASVAGLAFVLVQTLPRDPGTSSTSRSSAEIAASAPHDSAVLPAPPHEEVLPAPAAPGRQALDSPAETDAVPAPPRTEPVVAEVGSEPQAQVVAPERASNADVTSTRTAPATAPPAAAVAKSSAADQVSAPAGLAATAEMSRERSSAEASPDPQAWADRIAALHAAGDLDAAAASLRDFRAAHDRADEFLPVALRAWAGSVK